MNRQRVRVAVMVMTLTSALILTGQAPAHAQQRPQQPSAPWYAPLLPQVRLSLDLNAGGQRLVSSSQTLEQQAPRQATQRHWVCWLSWDLSPLASQLIAEVTP